MVSSTFLCLFAVIWSCTLFQPAHLQTVSSDPNDIKFYLYANAGNSNDTDTLVYPDPASVSDSRYDSNKKVLVLIHGFAQNYTDVFPQALIASYLTNGYVASWNIIAVAWDALSTPQPLISLSSLNATILSGNVASALTLIGYPLTINNTIISAQRVADFLQFLNITKEIHIIGMSEGAHVAGISASIYTNTTGLGVDRVTGLDPAGPLFQDMPTANRLDATDAIYVDVVHTNQGQFGYLGALGDADYYVNGGALQPCCLSNLNPINQTPVMLAFCAHGTAIDYYVQSIPTSFTTKGCTPVLGNCATSCSLPLTCTSCTNFGERSPSSASGPYCLDLSDNNPCT